MRIDQPPMGRIESSSRTLLTLSHKWRSTSTYHKSCQQGYVYLRMSAMGSRDEYQHGRDQETDTSFSQESDVREADRRLDDDVEGGNPNKAAPNVTGVSSAMGGVKMHLIRSDRRRFFVRGMAVALTIVTVSVLVAVFTSRRKVASATLAPSRVPTSVPTQSPTSMELREVMGALREIADSDNLEDTSSAQYQAAMWLARDQEVSGQSYNLSVGEAKFIQRYALAVLYYALAGDPFFFCGPGVSHKCDGVSWLTDSDECTWRGVECSDGKLVDRMSFSKLTSVGFDDVPPRDAGPRSYLSLSQKAYGRTHLMKRMRYWALFQRRWRS